MIRKRLDELQGNEILAKPIMTWDYQIILPEGAVLKEEYIDKIADMGIFEVLVEEEQTNSSEIVILKSNIKEVVLEKVKDILERHTYQNNEELMELCGTADDIISNILEEDQVVEKVFDIKERSTDIYEHSISICSLAILTALRLKVDRSIIHDIGVGCLLHDIGLRYMTVDFVNKDINDMSKAELAEYKKHPVYGYTSLREEAWISELSKNIILNHHERIDGSGFPLRLKEIPLACGIVAVCDAFDEMICGIGQKRIKVYEAVEYLKSFKNVKFDGKIIDAFLRFTAVYPAGTQVLTSEGEIALVVSQNRDFQDRPVLKIIKDKEGNPITEERILDLVKVHNVFIEKEID